MVSKKSSEPASRGEPKTMAELLASAERKVRGISTGQKVRGKVVSKNFKSLILDIGGKGEGVVAEKAFVEARDFIKTLKVGDEILATVLIPENREGYALLSLRQAAFESSWQKLNYAKEKGTAVVVYGKGANPSGITVEVEGLTGFIPGSQLGKEAARNTQLLIGKYFKAIPVEVVKESNKIILSEKEVSEAGDLAEAKKELSKVKEGEIYEGEVTTVANFGCFVKIKLGKIAVEGLVHISELSWSKVANTTDIVKEGDKVKVKVIGIKDGKLALSIKDALKNPWEDADKKYKPEQKIKGKVTRVSDFGVFVEVEPGIEGLIHLTKIPPATKLVQGQEVNCYVEEIDTKAKKFALRLVLTSKPVGYK